MNYSDYKQSENFIFSDIQREIDIAKSGKHAGNFLCALGLMCYTEFAGGLIRNTFKIGESKKNFNYFFRYMGKKYKELLKNDSSIYKFLRCGLAHEYYVKKNCIIYMPGLRSETGIRLDKCGVYRLYIGKYFEDFKMAFERFEKDICKSV